jgi:hypothetical protein
MFGNKVIFLLHAFLYGIITKFKKYLFAFIVSAQIIGKKDGYDQHLKEEKECSTTSPLHPV